MSNILLKCLVGSHAYGTNIESSDEDYAGIYQQPTNELLTWKYKDELRYSKDEVYYEIQKFLELCENANPTILSMLFSPEDCIIHKDPVLDILFENRHKFITKKCKHSFGGYAVQQIAKAKGLQKKQNWEKDKIEKKNPIDFCYVVMDKHTGLYDIPKQGVYPLKDWLVKQGLEENQVCLNKLNHTKEGYQLYYFLEDGKLSSNGLGILTRDSSKLKVVSTPHGQVPIATILFNPDAYTQHKRDYVSYQTWLMERNEARYTDFLSHGQGIDGKNMLHCRRLIDMALEIPVLKTLNVRRPNADYLISIRRGEVSLEELIVEAEKDILKMDELFDKSDLPHGVDSNLKVEILSKIRGI